MKEIRKFATQQMVRLPFPATEVSRRKFPTPMNEHTNKGRLTGYL